MNRLRGLQTATAPSGPRPGPALSLSAPDAKNIQGRITKVLFENAATCYRVLKAFVPDFDKHVTVVGHFIDVCVGENFQFEGAWSTHSKYGPQFIAESYEKIYPKTTEGLKKYLASANIKGIGPVFAGRLVDAFGADVIDVIERTPERLYEVEGIGKKRVDLIVKAWQEQRAIKDVMIFFATYGVGTGAALRIYRKYGDNTIEVVKANPYRLIGDVFGIGFKTADDIALKLGFLRDNPLRIEAGILYALGRSTDSGHCYALLPELKKQVVKILDIVKNNLLDSYLLALSGQEKIKIDNEMVYPIRLYEAERSVVQNLMRLNRNSYGNRSNSVELLEWAEKLLKMRFSDEQADAIKKSVNNRLLVVTGGPGVGKTASIRAIIEIQKKLKRRILLAAPTGRASKRAAQMTGHDASTIHRLLEFSPMEMRFTRNMDNPLEADTVIIDETSMVDILLMNSLVKALPDDARLILVGDVDQLPSVGPGSVLRDLIESGCLPVVRLNKIFRQAEESDIIVNAHRVNTGSMPVMKPDTEKTDFIFIKQQSPEAILRTITEIVRTELPALGYNSFNDIQVLTPMHKGEVGTKELNARLQEALNPSRDSCLVLGDKTFRINDKVMQTRNNYDKDVFNGDIGRISAIDKEMQQVTIVFEDKDVVYEYEDLEEIIQAYAITVHKSQGSEYPVVIMPCVSAHRILLQRNLLYTAITRGKSLVILIGEQSAVEYAVRNDSQNQRFTDLKARLQKEFFGDSFQVSRLSEDPFLDLKRQINSCTRCRLSQNRNCVAFGEGNQNADMVFISGTSSEEEGRQGRVFQGLKGILLNKILEKIGFSRADVYLCNALKCQPLASVDISAEFSACRPHLLAQLSIIRPKAICCLGTQAYNALFEVCDPVTKLRGTVKEFDGVPVLTTYDPVFAFHRNKMDEVLADVTKLQNILDSNTNPTRRAAV